MAKQTVPAVPASKQSEKPRLKNLCAKTRPASNPYEVWKSFDGTWTWLVLKKWQADDSKPFARWFCLVKSPFVPEGEMGDVYVREIKSAASRMQPEPPPDFTVQNEGSIFLLRPLTPTATAWVEEHLPSDRQTFGNGTVVEHRYIMSIIDEIQADGLKVARQ